MRFLKVAVIAPLLLLGACASPQAPANTPVVKDPLAGLKAFTLTDLQAASADAHANNDQAGYQCYDFLATLLPTLPSYTPGSTIGATLVFQKLRDLNNGLQSQQGAIKSLNLACAPLVIDTQTTINRLLLIGAGGAASGGVAAPLIPMIGTVLPTLIP